MEGVRTDLATLRSYQIQGDSKPSPTFLTGTTISLFGDQSRGALSVHLQFSYCLLFILSLE